MVVGFFSMKVEYLAVVGALVKRRCRILRRSALPRDLSDLSGDASVGASEMPKGGKLICALKNSDQSEKLELAVF